jgi:hypothetical protein
MKKNLHTDRRFQVDTNQIHAPRMWNELMHILIFDKIQVQKCNHEKKLQINKD